MGKAGNVILWILLILGVAILAYGAVGLLAPKYKAPKRRRSPKGPRYLARLGSYELEPGEGISYGLSGQRFSYDAPGQNPNLEGYYNRDTHETPDPEGEADFFEMFMQ